MAKWSSMALVGVALAAGLAGARAQAWGNPHAGEQGRHHGAPPRVGVLLYGAGMMDGTEVQEAVLTLLALERGGARVVPIAPAGPQADVVNHQTAAATCSSSRRASPTVESSRWRRSTRSSSTR